MISKALFLLLGLAALSAAKVVGNLDHAAGKVIEKIEKSGHKFPAFKEPTEEEWVGIIRESLQGAFIPSYLKEKNYTFEVTETGKFSDSLGDHGTWNSSAYVFYYPGENQLARRIFYIRYESLEESLTAIGTESYALFTNITRALPAYAAGAVKFSTTFDVRENYEFVRLSNSYGFIEGEGVFINSTLNFLDFGLELVNASNHYGMSETEVQGQITLDKKENLSRGVFVSNSIPLSPSVGKELLSLKNPISVAKKLKDYKVKSFVAVTEGEFKGELTGGNEGTFKSESSSTTMNLPASNPVNTTITTEGKYKEVNSTNLVHPALLKQSLLEVFTTGLF